MISNSDEYAAMFFSPRYIRSFCIVRTADLKGGGPRYAPQGHPHLETKSYRVSEKRDSALRLLWAAQAGSHGQRSSDCSSFDDQGIAWGEAREKPAVRKTLTVATH